MRHETLCESITGLTDELMSATDQRGRCKSDRKQPQKATRHSRESESEKCGTPQPQMEHNWIINRMIGANNNKTHKHVHDRLRFGECARAPALSAAYSVCGPAIQIADFLFIGCTCVALIYILQCSSTSLCRLHIFWPAIDGGSSNYGMSASARATTNMLFGRNTKITLICGQMCKWFTEGDAVSFVGFKIE